MFTSIRKANYPKIIVFKFCNCSRKIGCFYIIHKFFDPEYKFNGLFHFILYLIGLEKKVRGASIEEAALHILRRRGYKINTEDNIISKGQDKTDSPKQRKSKVFWDDDIKK